MSNGNTTTAAAARKLIFFVYIIILDAPPLVATARWRLLNLIRVHVDAVEATAMGSAKDYKGATNRINRPF